jgi:hypothetical protein
MPNLAAWVADAYAEITVSQQPASAEDTAAITTKVAPLVADLTARRIYTLASTASIPDNAYNDLVSLLAEHSASLFGRDPARDKIALYEAHLREIDRYLATPSELVRRVLELMEAWGQTRNAMDAATVLGHATNIQLELIARRVISSTNIATTKALPELARYIAAALSAPPLADIMTQAAAALREIDRSDITVGTELDRRVLDLLAAWGQGQNAINVAAIAEHADDIKTDLVARRIISSTNIASPKALPELSQYIAAALSSPPNAAVMAASIQNLREIDRSDRSVGVELVRRVMDLLAVYGQSNNAIDATAVADSAEEIIAELAVRGVVTVNAIDDVDPAVMPNLSRYIAAALCSPPHYPIMDRSAKELRTQTRTVVDETPFRAMYY